MRVVTGLLVLALLLAGCSSGGNAPSGRDSRTGTDNPADVDVDPRSEQGAISGVVVDDAIRPLPGARVVLRDGSRNTTSDAAGTFSFTDLDPGSYFLEGSLAGYLPVQASADVRAGQATTVKIQLAMLPAAVRPYNYTLQHSGYVVASAAAAGVLADAALDGLLGQNPMCDSCIFTVERDGADIRTFVIDMVWDNTVPPVTGEDLFLTIINENFTTAQPGWGASVTPPFHQHLQENDTVFNDGDNSSWWRFQVGGSLLQPTYNQRYDLFVTVFVNAPAPDGWSLLAAEA